jgi:hypothetical protein
LLGMRSGISGSHATQHLCMHLALILHRGAPVYANHTFNSFPVV